MSRSWWARELGEKVSTEGPGSRGGARGREMLTRGREILAQSWTRGEARAWRSVQPGARARSEDGGGAQVLGVFTFRPEYDPPGAAIPQWNSLPDCGAQSQWAGFGNVSVHTVR